MMTYLTLGCGSRYHPAWIVIDVAPQSPEVIKPGLSRGIPLANASCSVVYHAAMLEHLRRADARALLQECHRVLKPKGIIRIGVPDLERLCQPYLQELHRALTGDGAAAHDNDWIMLEIYDQIVRKQSGGEMLAFLRQEPLLNESLVYSQIGEEGRQLVQAMRRQNGPQPPEPALAVETPLRRLHRRFVTLPAAAKRRVLGTAARPELPEGACNRPLSPGRRGAPVDV